VLVLGIETSCDETAAAVVRDGKHVLSSVVHSQVALHGPYGGVVPEIASRSHVKVLPGIVAKAMEEAGAGYGDIDAVAVTYGPGLASSLMVGVAAAKALSIRLSKPLCAVNHLEAHMFSVFLDGDTPSFSEKLPLVALVVSGGHTCLVKVDGLGRYELLGQTIDDAAGEAFDKGANLLQLGYPGGPVIDRISRGANPQHVRFPRGRQKKGRSPLPGLREDLCFSYSGVKTALLYYLKAHPLTGDEQQVADIAASYQEAILDALVDRCSRVADETGVGTLAAGGGVSLNSRLRAKLAALAEEKGLALLLAKPCYCGDNAAMIAGLAGLGGCISGDVALAIDVDPNLPVVAVDL
jgi:N6-L-threonylcarbamoyladenine synthase